MEEKVSALANEGDAMAALVERGFVQIAKRGVLVTPDGLAAALIGSPGRGRSPSGPRRTA